jgi:hypothetical protein
VALPFHQFLEKALCSLFILTLLHQNIENISVPKAFAPLMGQAFLIYCVPPCQTKATWADI